ncbi:MAG: Cell division coordinator CpoB [Chroococcopsis gigantea SAG 12.99]|jgi:tetratricopeptide (TPR) repeat protein|nr:tetratricopeptide repeat protein [Chlorogloea purpurea SAG 13.99]MDV3001622.1 Cell division coordinator CpoB [Chroococcopsis gigantea SAG 12.99]
MPLIIAFLLSLCLILGINPPAFAALDTVPGEAQIQAGEAIARKALDATHRGNFAEAEKYWTQLLADFPGNPAVWSNRGNARVSQNKLVEAIADFNQAIDLAPDAGDPYLNRGAALEGQGKYEEAIADYNHVLDLDPKDPMAYNNRGNAQGGLGNWQEAVKDFQQAALLAPDFAWAQANLSLALYQMGQQEEALKKMKNLVRKYPMFPDMRAALTAVLWAKGQQGEAESNWVATVGMDHRYQDLEWVKNVRRWPPSMVGALDKFLNLK